MRDGRAQVRLHLSLLPSSPQMSYVVHSAAHVAAETAMTSRTFPDAHWGSSGWCFVSSETSGTRERRSFLRVCLNWGEEVELRVWVVSKLMRRCCSERLSLSRQLALLWLNDREACREDWLGVPLCLSHTRNEGSLVCVGCHSAGFEDTRTASEFFSVTHFCSSSLKWTDCKYT